MKFIPLAHNSKVPLAGDDWHNRITDDEDVWSRWLWEGMNLGMPLRENGRIVADFDDKEAARAFWIAHRDICTVVVETRRGAHFYFSGELPQSFKFEYGDLKASGYVVYPPSEIDGFTYRHVREEAVQPFPAHLFPAIQATRNGVQGVTRGPVKDVAAYLAKIESIAGQNGSAGLVRAAAVCRDAGYSEAEALLRLIEWNKTPVVSPPWPDRELARAVTRVFAKK